ncbi:MAG: ABC transporter substrate-binding protein [Actinomycetota bacterium]
MLRSKRWLRLLAMMLAFGLVAAACGDSDDDSGDDGSESASASASASEPADEGSASASEPADEGSSDTTEAMDDEEMADDMGGELATEGSVEIAAGTTLNLDECPDDWSATQGVDGDEIRLGWTGPQSGQLAAFGAIGEGMQFWFDFINETAPVDGKELTLVIRDDAYEAGRSVANVEEMIETEDIFAFAHIIGTPNNLAVRPATDEACVPQLFNSTGFPFWGDPANFPWTVGNILNYVTETEIWCTAAIDEFGEGATVAALIMNNDFGTTYLNTLKDSPVCAGLELVEEQLHDPAAPDVTNEMTTIISSDADVFVAGTTAAFCPQAVGAVAASEWRPAFFMSYTCNNLASFLSAVPDEAGLLADEGAGVRMANSNKVCGDPTFADDPAILEIEEVLAEYGGVTCADGSFSTGVLYGQLVTDLLEQTVAEWGELNRVTMMATLWNISTSNPSYFDGATLQLDGVNDAYWTEAAVLQEVQLTDAGLVFVSVGDLVNFEGQGGSFAG